MKKLFLFVAAVCCGLTVNAAKVECSIASTSISYNYSQIEAGDTLVLLNGTYEEPWSWNLNKADVVIMAKEGAHPVIDMGSNGAYMQVYNSTTFVGVKFINGKYDFFMNNTDAKNLVLEGCEFTGATSYNISSSGSAHTDSIFIRNCYFHDNATSAVYMGASGATDKKPVCDYLEVKNSTITNVAGIDGVAVIDIRNNNNDKTGNGTRLVVDHVTIYNYAEAVGAPYGSNGAIMSYKSPQVAISNCIIANPEGIVDNQGGAMYSTYCYGGTIDNCLINNVRSHKSGPTITSCNTGDPLFNDVTAGDYSLKATSPAIGAATDGSNLGDPRWTGAEPTPELSIAFVTPDEDVTIYEAYAIEVSAEAPDGATYTVAYSADATTWTDIVTEETYEESAICNFPFDEVADGEYYLRAIIATQDDADTTICDFTITVQHEKPVYHTFVLAPGSGVIRDSIALAQAGDTIELTGDGTVEYVEGNSITIDKAITIRAAKGATPVVHIMKFKMNAAFAVEGIEFYGYEDYMFRTEVGGAFALSFKNCLIRNSSAYFIYISSGQTIDALTIDNCIFRDNTKSEQPVINGYGIIKSFEMTNTTIMNCPGSYPVRVRNSSHILIDHCTLYNVGIQALRLEEDSKTKGDVRISNTVVANTTETTDYAYYLYRGQVVNCVYYNTGSFRSDTATTATNLVNADPKFVNAADGNLNWTSESPLKGTATDGSNIGDPRWVEAAAQLAVSFVAPAAVEEAMNDYTIKFAVVNPTEVSATLSIDYSYDNEEWNSIMSETYSDQTEVVFATRGLAEGEIYLRAKLVLDDKSDSAEAVNQYLTIVKDTRAPRAIANFVASVDGANATLTWENPTREIPVGGSLLGEGDLLENASIYGTTATMEEENDVVKVTATAGAWAQVGISFDATIFENVKKLAFKVKGDPSVQLDVFMVQNGYDWWHKAFYPTEDWMTFENTEWSKVDWHNNSKATTFDGNNVTNVMITIDNGVAVENSVYYLDSVMVEGVVAPSEYYTKTIIRRSEFDFPATIEDGDVVYEGNAETTVDEIDPTKTYYYTAFAVDDIDNVAEGTPLMVEGQQVTHTIFNVTVPEGTEACFLVGSFNEWAVDEGIEMEQVDATHFTYQAEVDMTGAEYKYVHGDEWAYVEKDAQGGEISNRVVNAAVMNDVVARWADQGADLNEMQVNKHAVKAVRNGMIVIERNGVRYNVLGAQF